MCTLGAMAKPKTKAKAKAKPTAKASAKTQRKPKSKPVAKAKAKAKAKSAKPKAKPAKARATAAKAKAQRVGKAAGKAKAAVKPVARASKPAAKAATTKPTPTPPMPAAPPPDITVEQTTTAPPTPGLAPFSLVETEPGEHSLLLSIFEPASEVFQAAGLEGGGYAWEGIARYVTEVMAPELAHRFGLDPEASMFCAYGSDRGALEQLGKQLSTMFHNKSLLAAVIEEVGPAGFQD